MDNFFGRLVETLIPGPNDDNFLMKDKSEQNLEENRAEERMPLQ